METQKNKYIQLGITTTDDSQNPLIIVESLPPMTPAEFARWLFNATSDPKTEDEIRRQKERLLARCVVPTWKASEASAEEIKEMARRREIWNAVKKEHPFWSKLEIDAEAQKRLAKKHEKKARIDKFEAEWNKALESGVLDDLMNID